MLTQSQSKDRLIVALDVSSAAAARHIVQSIGDAASTYKVGKQLFTAEGPQVVRDLVASGRKVFLDLKFHDIPNTVAAAVRSASDLGVSMLTVHASGGSRMLKAAVEAAAQSSAKPLVLAVTVLTSFTDADLQEIGVPGTALSQVLASGSARPQCRLRRPCRIGQRSQGVAARTGRRLCHRHAGSSSCRVCRRGSGASRNSRRRRRCRLDLSRRRPPHPRRSRPSQSRRRHHLRNRDGRRVARHRCSASHAATRGRVRAPNRTIVLTMRKNVCGSGEPSASLRSDSNAKKTMATTTWSLMRQEISMARPRKAAQRKRLAVPAAARYTCCHARRGRGTKL